MSLALNIQADSGAYPLIPTSLKPDASAMLAGDISEPGSAAANATPGNAAAILPPRAPITYGQVFG